MAQVPIEAAAALLATMKPDIALWRSGEDIDVEARYGGAIQTIGAVVYLTALFRATEGSTLSAYLNAVAFLWRDLPFSAWQEILYAISDSKQAVYEFVWFTSPFLRLDILAMIRTDPKVADSARDFVRFEFSSGAPAPTGNWERDVLQNNGVAPVALWRRLAAEGAPMKLDPADTEPSAP